MVDLLKLPLHFDPARLKADLQALTPADWVMHFNKPYHEGEWSGVALRAVNGAEGRLYPDPTAREVCRHAHAWPLTIYSGAAGDVPMRA